jgi:hypothetical protein
VDDSDQRGHEVRRRKAGRPAGTGRPAGRARAAGRACATGSAVVAVVASLMPLGACGGDDGSTTSGTTAATEAPTGAPDEAAADAPVIDPGDGGDYRPALDPAATVDVIDNPYLPLLPGSRWVYEGVSEGEQERIEVVVTDERRQVMGIDAVVVRDTVSVDGAVAEDTYDWFTQDREGNVWYLGEETAEYEDGEVVSTAGSWEAGVDGALPGVVMLARPTVGDAYRQEFYEGEAEDMAEVARLGESRTVAGTTYDDLVVIEEWNPLEPEVVEEKYYAPGVGNVFELATRGSDERVELVSYAPPS